jgi:competence protein ComEC
MLALWRGSRPLAAACCLPGFVCAGALIALVRAPGPPPVIDASAREILILGGCVVEPPAISGERERFVLELEPHARAQVTLYTRQGESLPHLRYGQRVEVDARIRKPHNFGNPGAFDYAGYLGRQEIYWTASAAAGTVHVQPGGCGSAWEGAIMNLRAGALDRIARLFSGNDYLTAMTQALLIGQNFQLQRVWTEQYRNTGTFHVIVISGTHVAILAAFFLFLLRICFVPEGAALLATVLGAWLYAGVAGWGAPCVRSAAGLTFLMVCGYFYRQRRPINLLAAVALGFLVFDPGQLFEASFQLTFLAVAFLGLFATPLIAATSGPLARGLRDLDDKGRDIRLAPRVAQFRIEMRLLIETLHGVARLPRAVARAAVTGVARTLLFVYELAAVSAVVQTGIALPMVVYFHRMGLSGLSANVLVVPIMGLAVPLGFIAVATGWVWMAKLTGWLLMISRVVVGWHADLEPNWRIPGPPVWLAVGLSLALVALACARGRRWWSAAGSVTAALLVLMLWHPFPAEVHPGSFELTAIDVGQGDCLLVVAPDGRRMLVDSGGLPNYGGRTGAQMDIGEDVVAPALWGRGIRSVDVAVVSHGHEDHLGGMASLIADFRPRELWTGVMPDSPGWLAVRRAAERQGVKIVPLLAPASFNWGGGRLDVLAPFADDAPGEVARNNDSLVLRLRYGRHAFLLAGDAERAVEDRMLSQEEIGRADVLKVAHHGSRTSSTEEFLDAVSPSFGVISVGLDNSYGLPNTDVIERLESRHAAVYRTDRDGQITVLSDGHRIQVATFR